MAPYLYTVIFNYTILALIIIAFLQCESKSIFEDGTVSLTSGFGVLFSVALILFMGLRPVGFAFGDMIVYNAVFQQYANSPDLFVKDSDWLFYNLMSIFSKFTSAKVFFLFCSFCYVGSFWLAMRRMFKSYYYIPFLVILSMFTFWNYGVNGIRNGMGAAIFILALTYVDRLPVAILLAFVAMGIHSSVYLMTAAAGAAFFYKNSKHYLIFWFLCIVMSLVAGGAIQGALAGAGIFGDDERFTSYLTSNEEVQRQQGMVVKTGFRWDFLIYSAVPVAVGYYFIFKQKFQDEYYHWIYNIYLLTNSFWVLIIRAAYSNRFAQISWFIMPVVLVYPFVKARFWENQENKLGYALLVFYAFTFVYNVVPMWLA